MSDPRSMILVGFMQAQNCSNYTGSWRHPATEAGYLTPEYYEKIARTLEHGKFDLVFFDDRLAMPDRFRDNYDDAVRYGIRPVKLDLIPILTAMAMATEHLGVGATYSTTYYEPFHVARLFATLDHITKGRVAWNVVTSLNDSEAANFGAESHLKPDARYDRADEFMQVVLGLWDSWEVDAIVGDRRRGVFGDPTKVHRLDHKGAWFRCRGPLTVPRCPQGHPVIIQAGQSGRGRKFAAQWGELIFAIFPSMDVGRKRCKEFRASVAQVGRNPDAVKVATAVYIVVGETESIAKEKAAFLSNLADPVDSLVLLAEMSNYDFSQHELDQDIPDEAMRSISGSQSLKESVSERSGKANPSLRDFVEYSGRGTMKEMPTIVGTPEMVADQLEEWFKSGACDGFVIAASHLPGAYEDFVRLVVPELQRRGVHRHDYQGRTLRENMGFNFPSRGSLLGAVGS